MAVSSFAEKVLKGESTSAAEWAAHLRAAHARHPGMSPPVFAVLSQRDGPNSYERLAGVLKSVEPHRVLDLACGDGYLFQYVWPHLGNTGKLVGLDASPEELSLAALRYPRRENLRLVHGLAEQTGLPDESFEAILCHMAFMLLLPVEAVASEVLRLLKPGGIFAAVVPRPQDVSGLMSQMHAFVGTYFHLRYPQMKSPQTGDPRSLSANGWREIFPTTSKIESDDFTLNFRVPPEDVWKYWRHTYLVELLEDGEKEKLQRSLIALAEKMKDEAGLASFSLPLRLLTFRKPA